MLITREQEVDGVSSWTWLEHDTGAWDGPVKDWVDSHKKTILANVKAFRSVLQAGGCCGLYPRLLSQMFETVYTFEPDPLSYECLLANCPGEWIIKRNAALGDAPGMVTMNHNSRENVGMNTVTVSPEGVIPVVVVDDLELGYLDFMMLDVEGYEPLIVRGAEKTIKRLRPVISVERPKQELTDLLTSWGYRSVAQSVSDTYFAPG